MSMTGLSLTSSKECWKGTEYIERKLGSVLDKKVASQTKQVLLDRIQFKAASHPDPFYNELRRRYTPLNSANNKQHTDNKNNDVKNEINRVKDGIPPPKVVLFEQQRIDLNWKNIRKIGPGLYNLGNTCFLNSVIQVLTYTAPLVNYLATQEHGRTCEKVGFCMLCELQRHVVRTFSHSQNEAIKPMAIIQKLKYIAKHLRFGQQEDSHEFLRYVIDGMQKSCLVGLHQKLDAYSKATTMVHHIFGGFYRSQVTCEKCQHTSNTYDPLMEVLLDIKHASSVQKALHKLTSSESLHGDNMYLCPRCKCKVVAKKHLTVHRAPNVLTMCLKRFDCHSLFGTKINKEIVYPEQLNLRPFMSKTQGRPVNYKLYAVLVHSGYSCNSGHYFCFVKASNNIWYQMNDASVRQVGLKSVLSQQAYLLFYIKQVEKEKQNHTVSNHKIPQQNQQTNGVHKSATNSIKNTPKIITDNTKAGYPATFTGPQRPTSYGTTMLPETRDKISFTLNQPRSGVTNKDAETTIKQQSDSKECKPDEKVPSSIVTNHGHQGNIPSMMVAQNGGTQVGTKDELTSTTGEVDEGKCANIHATTQWKVATTPTSLLPGGLVTSRERTPSLSSDVSIASKTGDWSVSERTSLLEQSPRVPERQHAGWKVSTPDDDIGGPKKKERDNDIAEEVVPDPDKSVEKKLTSKNKSEKNTWKTDDKTRLLSDAVGDSSEDVRVEKKRHKKKKHKKHKSRNDENKNESDNEQNDEERGRKKSKKKRKHRSNSKERYSGKELKKEVNKVVNKAKETLNSVYDRTMKKKTRERRPLVEYSDHTSSSEDGQDNRGSSRSDRERDDHNRIKSRKKAGHVSDGGDNRKRVVDTLLEKSSATHNYGCQVDSWETCDRVSDNMQVENQADTTKRKRDSWDEEYDEGKVKRVRKKEHFHLNRSFPAQNAFQKEYDKRRMKQSSWHALSSQGWHNRSYDRHRDRR